MILSKIVSIFVYEKGTRHALGKQPNMSKNRNRARYNKAQTNKEYRIIWLDINYPPYWDEGIYLYPKYRRGYKNSNKRIFPSQVRMYRTWKYNRKTQYR